MQKKIDLINGPILSSLTKLALPIMATSLIQMAYNMIDMIWIGRLGSSAVASVGAAGMYMWLSNGLVTLARMGGQVHVGHAVGAGRTDFAGRYAATTFQMTLLLGVLYGLVCTIFSKPLIAFFHLTSRSVINDAVSYLMITCGLVIFSFLNQIFTGLFTAIGNSHPAFLSTSVGLVINIILDPLIIFGIGPIPRLGIEGAALATGSGQVTPVVIYWIIYKIRPISVKIRLDYLKEGKNLGGRLYAIGVPAILNLALPSLLISALNGILAVYSQSYVVVLGIYYKLQTFLYLPANGIVQGMRPLIGYNYGAREHARVKKLYELTLFMSIAIMALGTVICLLASGQLIGLITSNPDTIAAGAKALRIICIGFVVSAVSTTSSGALEGLGKGVPSLVISLCRYVVFIMPLAAVLCGRLGPDGVWHAFWITEVLAALVAYPVYHRAAARH